MRTTDNNQGKSLDTLKEFPDEIYEVDNLKYISNLDLKDVDSYPNLLLFPQKWNMYHDDVPKSGIFTLSDPHVLETKNIIGFIGYKNTNLAISSRFTEADKRDFFLHYMLQKVMAINVLDLAYSGGKDDIWDFLIFCFPYFLNRALVQGLYKEYKYSNYNDANVHGPIDIKRHLRINNPFAGKVAYSTREFNNDNPVTQIIRHTIEYIKSHKYSGILTADNDVYSNINQIVFATHEYNRNDRLNIINLNKGKPVVHPYFTEYKALQRLCIRILTNEKISTNNENEKIHGILFDGAWLWEEYLNKVIGESVIGNSGFKHPENRKGKGGYNLFDKGNTIYPDFIRESDRTIADAKYKFLDRQSGNNSDYFQIMAYMLRFSSKIGFLIFPHQGYIDANTKYILDGFTNQKENRQDKKISLIGFHIPQNIERYTDFINAIKKSEDELIKRIILSLSQP